MVVHDPRLRLTGCLLILLSVAALIIFHRAASQSTLPDTNKPASAQVLEIATRAQSDQSGRSAPVAAATRPPDINTLTKQIFGRDSTESRHANPDGRSQPRVEFHGTRVISDSLLEQAVTNVPADTYPERMPVILSRALHDIYARLGYFEANIAVEPLPEKPGTYSVNIEAGNAYKWGDIQVTSETIPSEDLRLAIPIQAGQVADLIELKDLLSAFVNSLHEQGYPECSYTPEFSYNRQTRTLGVKIKVHQGPHSPSP